MQAIGAALRGDVPSHGAPDALRARIDAALLPGARAPRRWPALAASLVVGAMLGAGAMWPLVGTGDRRTEELVAGHVRSMMADHLTDVASSDQHTVRPWFAGKIAVAPPVRDLSDQGIELLGGRLDYIEGAPAAAVVYRKRKHVINLFVAPARGSGTSESTASNGYNVEVWTKDGLAFRAVSDLNRAELRAFAAALRGE